MRKITYTKIFKKYFKRYNKKYKSLKSDFELLENQLLENPKLGTYLGDNLYKIRLAVKSKNKGKSGGFRVVTYLIKEHNNNTEIRLIILYDKSDIANITKDELINIIKLSE